VARWERGESPIGNPEVIGLAIAQLASRTAEKRNHHAPAQSNRRSSIQGRSPARIKLNLPVERTSLIGRDRELAAIGDALLHAEGRLITLTGPGGAGKTRLAHRVGRDLIDAFADGVCLVEVASQLDSVRLPQAIASALGVRERTGQPMIDTLTEALSRRQLLLLLDNCEDLVQACALLVDALLSGCPRLRVLATSREPLGVLGEVVWQVPPLVVPPMQSPTGFVEISTCAAVQLFVERARSVRSDFTLTPDNAGAIGEICTLLEGLPLALELAAARMRVLGTDQIREQVRDSLRLLIDDKRSTPGRHRSLEAALDSSYAHLSVPEQDMFRRLAIFAGGWSLEAAEAVCVEDEATRGRSLDLLTQLLDKSLVVMVEHDGRARYRVLEPIRQYAQAKLLVSGESPAVRQRHANYYCELSERLSHWPSPGLRINAERQREFANFRVAMSWALESDESQLGLRLAASLWNFWTLGWLSEGREWFTRLLDLSTSARASPVRARALLAASNMAFFQGDHVAASALARESVALWRELADGEWLADALDAQGLSDFRRGEMGSSKTALVESLQLARGLGLRALEAASLYHLGLVAHDLGDFDAAHDSHSRSMAIGTELSDIAIQARAYYGLGQVAHQRGDLVGARALHEAGLARRRAVGETWGMHVELAALGRISLDENDLAGAHAAFQQSLLLSRDLGDRHGVARSLEGMAAVAAAREPDRAVQLIEAAAALCEGAAAPLPEIERTFLDKRLAPAYSALGQERGAALIGSAKAMSLDEAVGLALGDLVLGPNPALSRRTSLSELLPPLTHREIEVLRLIACGQTNKEIAGTLVLSERTVERHITNLYAKIGARGRADATTYALRHDLS
jgi:predicted ATPase/DNA-binding NarL/FixJ family response regulator